MKTIDELVQAMNEHIANQPLPEDLYAGFDEDDALFELAQEWTESNIANDPAELLEYLRESPELLDEVKFMWEQEGDPKSSAQYVVREELRHFIMNDVELPETWRRSLGLDSGEMNL